MYRYYREGRPRPVTRPQRIPVWSEGRPVVREPELVRAESLQQNSQHTIPINEAEPLAEVKAEENVLVSEESPEPQPELAVQGEVDNPWKIKALQLQAEMDNFRKRQLRRADEAVAQEQARLLQAILPVADNLSRALDLEGVAAESLRQGVELTYRELKRVLEAEGVTQVESSGQPFDPRWHEAVSLVEAEVESGTVLQELEAGYQIGDKLLRPAKVVVAA